MVENLLSASSSATFMISSSLMSSFSTSKGPWMREVSFHTGTGSISCFTSLTRRGEASSFGSVFIFVEDRGLTRGPGVPREEDDAEMEERRRRFSEGDDDPGDQDELEPVEDMLVHVDGSLEQERVGDSLPGRESEGESSGDADRLEKPADTGDRAAASILSARFALWGWGSGRKIRPRVWGITFHPQNIQGRIEPRGPAHASRTVLMRSYAQNESPVLHPIPSIHARARLHLIFRFLVLFSSCCPLSSL